MGCVGVSPEDLKAMESTESREELRVTVERLTADASHLDQGSRSWHRTLPSP
jgi:hypothetical protein